MKAGDKRTDTIFGQERYWIAVYPNIWPHEIESLKDYLSLMNRINDPMYLDAKVDQYKRKLMYISDQDYIIYHEKNSISMRHDSPAWKLPQERYFEFND